MMQFHDPILAVLQVEVEHTVPDKTSLGVLKGTTLFSLLLCYVAQTGHF